MSNRVSLKSLVAPEFADGFAAFEDFDNRAAHMARAADHPPATQAAMRTNHLLTVAMVEALNDAEEDFGIEPLEAVFMLWRNVGVVLATVGAQAFTAQTGKVRAEMLTTMKRGYDDMAKAIEVANKRDAEGGAA